MTAALNTPNPITPNLDNPVAEGGAVHRIIQANNEAMQHMTVIFLIPDV
jgi:hypothetical protein